MATQTGTSKPAARKPPATSDDELLEQQAKEEAAAEAIAGVMRDDVDAARVAAELAGKLGVLRALYSLRHGEGAGVPEDHALLALEAELLAPPAAMPADLPVASAGSDLAAILAAQQASFLTAFESVAEKLAGARGSEMQVSLSGSAEELIRQLAGTVDDGGDGDNPLDEPVIYVSRGAMFKAVKKPRYRGVGPTGEQFFSTGIAADFAPTGQWQTRNPEMVAWLETRPGFGIDFWRLGAEPYSAPDSSVVVDKIIELVLALDDKKLAELEADEKASHKRPVVLKALATARNRVQAFEGGE